MTMRLPRISLSTLLNFLPGLIILGFGIYALQVSVLMIQNNREYIQKYRGFGMEIMELQQQLIQLELVHHGFFDKKTQEKFDIFYDMFLTVSAYHEKILNNKTAKDFVSAEDYDALLSIKGKFEEIERIIADYKAGKAKKSQLIFSERESSVHAMIERLIGDVLVIQSRFFAKMDQTLTSDERGALKYNLYWAVIAISLSGFFLLALNNFKVHQIQAALVERKKTLALLQNRQAAIDSSRDGIMIIDSKGHIVYMNNALMDIHGIDKNESHAYIGKLWFDLFNEQDVQKIKYEVQPLLIRQGYWRGKFTIDKRDGTKAHTELSITKLDDGGLIGSTLDVTEEQRVRDERGRLEDQFFQAQKMEAIGRLTGGIAHDFNNILAAMNGYAEFLIEDLPPDSPQQGFAQNILQAGSQARDLVDRMLAFSRRSDSAVQAIDILESVSEASLMLQASLPKTIEVITDIRCADATIKGNATQIVQTIMNLCVNAKDAIENDHGTLTLHIERMMSDDFEFSWVIQDELPNPQDAAPIRIDDITEDQTRLVLGTLKKNTSYILLRVQDTGSGMSRVIMEHIFEPFFTTKPIDKGTGLGLATVHGVVTGHQGMLVIDSILGRGTTFDLFFPYVEDSKDDAFDFKSNRENGDSNIKSNDEVSKTILLVEDQENVRDMMHKMLERIGFTVAIATNGLEALDAIRENPEDFNLVITDHNMPRMTGLELVQQIHLDLPDLPFILFSGYSQKEIHEIQECHPAIKAVLRKPVTREILEQQISIVFDRAGAKSAA